MLLGLIAAIVALVALSSYQGWRAGYSAGLYDAMDVIEAMHTHGRTNR